MRTWRGVLILLVIVYVAGFATAVYCLAPPASTSREDLAASQARLDSTPTDRVVKAVGIALRKARAAGEDLVDRTTALIQSRENRSPPKVSTADGH